MNQIEQTLDSREVAEMVGKRHDHLIRDIKKYISEMSAPNFGEGNELKIEAVDFSERQRIRMQKVRSVHVMTLRKRDASLLHTN